MQQRRPGSLSLVPDHVKNPHKVRGWGALLGPAGQRRVNTETRLAYSSAVP